MDLTQKDFDDLLLLHRQALILLVNIYVIFYFPALQSIFTHNSCYLHHNFDYPPPPFTYLVNQPAKDEKKNWSVRRLQWEKKEKRNYAFEENTLVLKEDQPRYVTK